jgi:hypothetical protein
MAETSHGKMDFADMPEALQERTRQLVVEDIARKKLSDT